MCPRFNPSGSQGLQGGSLIESKVNSHMIMLPLYCNLFAEVQINQPSEAAASGRADRVVQRVLTIQALTARYTEFLIEWDEMYYISCILFAIFHPLIFNLCFAERVLSAHTSAEGFYIKLSLFLPSREFVPPLP